MSEFETKMLFLSEIDCAGRLRGLSQAHVETLAASIQERGLQSPLQVRETEDGSYRLIAGGHRVAALQLLERKMAECKVFSGISDREARLLEIDENLVRHELNPLDRAVFLAERKAIYEEMYPESKAGGDRKSAKFQNQSEMVSFWSFTGDAAEKLKLSKRTIERAVRIATGIPEALRQRLLAAEFLKEGELYNLTKYPPESQEKIVDLILQDENPAPNVKAAAAIMEGAKSKPVDGEEKQFLKLMEAWNRAPAKVRARFLEHLETEK